jgi:hypothetical protein
MRIIGRIKDIHQIRDSDGTLLAQKGTTCDLIDIDGRRYVKKRWHTGDWLFSRDYAYGIEKAVYLHGNAGALPVPRMVDFSDEDCWILVEHLDGAAVPTPCCDPAKLTSVLRFLDQYRKIGLPDGLTPQRLDSEIHKDYFRETLEYVFARPQSATEIFDRYYEMLPRSELVTAPFDRILHNAIDTRDGLRFFDFEWTVAAPFEFALARAAVEFQAYDHPEIGRRIGYRAAYEFSLLHFYLHGKDAEVLGPYLESEDTGTAIRNLYELVRDAPRRE